MIQRISQWRGYFIEYLSDYKNRSRAFMLVLFGLVYFLVYEVVIVALTYCKSYEPLFPYIMTLYFGFITSVFLYLLDRYSFFISYFFSLKKILLVVLFLLVGYLGMNVASWFFTTYLMPFYSVKGANLIIYQNCINREYWLLSSMQKHGISMATSW